MAPRPVSDYDIAFPSAYVDAESGETRGFCNWVIRGRVMVGRYPACSPAGAGAAVGASEGEGGSASDGSACTGGPSPEEAERHLRAVVGAGVNTFVMLQGGEGRREEDGGDEDDDDNNDDDEGGFRAGYYQDAVRIADELGAEPSPAFCHIPIRDFGDHIVDMDDLVGDLYDLRDSIKLDGAVAYLHGWGDGTGRAGTVGACLYLMLRLNDLASMSPGDAADRALEVVQRGYDTRVGVGGSGEVGEEENERRRSPGTEEQRQFVHRFANVLYGHQAW